MKDNFVGVIVDAGHGGVDSGAVGNNLLEKDLNLQAATYMYNRLKELGIPAKITREDDSYLPKDERIRKVLNLYNNNPNTILVSNHINAGGGEGAEVVYSLKNNSTLADLVLNNIGEAGQLKRKAYQRRLPENPNKDYYYILRETGNTEPILVEYGFIDNSRDATKLKNNLNDYVEGVVKALAEYTGYPYYKPNNSDLVIGEYTVQKGDTLYSISKRFNIPIDLIKRINNLESDLLAIGQKLYLKEDISPYLPGLYVVQKNDTLYSIAIKNNTTVNKIKELNNLESDILSIGQELIIPEVDNKDEVISDNEYEIYVVQKGDSLYSIAKKYNTTVPDLIEINNLSNVNLQIGKQLLIPIKEEATYTVQQGDTLWSIARSNGISVNELKEKNNLNSNLLVVGQELLI